MSRPQTLPCEHPTGGTSVAERGPSLLRRHDPFPRPAMRSLLCSAALAVLSTAPCAQQTLYEFRDPQPYLCAAAGDVDADGTPDFLVGTQLGRTQVRSGRTGQLVHETFFTAPRDGFPFAGTVGDLDGDGHDEFYVVPWIFSGRTGEILRVVPGRLLVGVDDLDDDGTPDLVASEPQLSLIRCGGHSITYGSGGRPGRIWALSGRTGEVLYEREARDGSLSFGGALVALDDLDGDGAGDFLVLEQTLGFGTLRPCGLLGNVELHAFSGRTGEQLWQADVATMDVVGIDDMDGDGVPDLALGFFDVTILSGRDGSELTTIPIGEQVLTDYAGVELDTLPDQDGDGKRELLVAASQRTVFGPFGSDPGGPGYVAVVSTGTGAELSRVTGDDDNDAFGTWLAGLGDVNGDEVFDYVAFATSAEPYVRVVSSAPVALTSDRHEVSVTSGGAQSLTIDVGTGAGSRVGLLLGSLTGTSPGLPFGGALLPLVPDAYLATLLAGRRGPLSGSPYVVLDADGRATRMVTVPAGLPLELAGRTVHHAFVLLDPSTPFTPANDRVPTALLVSPAVPLSLVP